MRTQLPLIVLILVFFSCKKNSDDRNTPHADAGRDITITLPLDSVTLGAIENTSTDHSLTYSWKQIAGPSSLVTITTAGAATTQVKNMDDYDPDHSGSNHSLDYRFELSVTNARGAISKDTVTVSVIFGDCSVGGLVWKQSAGGLMYLQSSNTSTAESFSGCGSGLEHFWPDQYNFYIKTSSGWTQLNYVNSQDKLTTSESVFMSSDFLSFDNTYSPAVYAKQNSGIDFSKTGLALIRVKH